MRLPALAFALVLDLAHGLHFSMHRRPRKPSYLPASMSDDMLPVFPIQIPRRRVALQRRLLQTGDCDGNYTLVGSTCVCSRGYYRDYVDDPSVSGIIETSTSIIDVLAMVPSGFFNMYVPNNHNAGPFQVGTSTWYGMYNVWTARFAYEWADPRTPVLCFGGLAPDVMWSAVWTHFTVTPGIAVVPVVAFSLFGAAYNLQGQYQKCVYEPNWSQYGYANQEGVVSFSWSEDGTTWTELSSYNKYPIGCDCLLTLTLNGFVPVGSSVYFRAKIDITGTAIGGYDNGGSGGPGSSGGKTVQLNSVTFTQGKEACSECPEGKTSDLAATSLGGCYTSYGILVNNTIDSVDPYYNQSDFTGLLPDYIQSISYSADEEVFLENCPAGYFCVSDTTIPQPCGAGTYRDVPGATSQADCFACPAGSYCAAGSPTPTYCPGGSYRGSEGAKSPQECATCTIGNYCPLGSSTPVNCSIGSYRASTGAAASVDCGTCPTGYYCPIASSTPAACPVGTFLDNTGGLSTDSCEPCTPGSYCPLHSTLPTQCAAGTYLGTYGGISQDDCVTCPVGGYCPVGSTAPTLCAAGSFRGVTAGVSQEDCTTCPTGSYCLAGVSAAASCPAGTFLTTSGGDQLEDCQPCTEGYFCVLGTSSPAECPAGTYRDILGAQGQSDCYTCPSGEYCVTASVMPTGCAAGTYRATIGAMIDTDCLACPAGQYCPFATTTPVDCPAGTYLTSTGGVDRSSCVSCPTGNYCPDKSTSPTQCPAGTFRAAVGAGASEDCSDCPTGQYCPQGTTTPTSCAAGTYRNATNGVQSGDCLTCPVGHYCPLRSTVPADCSQGTYRGSTGGVSQGSCTTCPSGSYCPDRSVSPIDCPAGKYNPSTGGQSLEQCYACPMGYYCHAATTTPSACQAGSYGPNAGNTAQGSCTTCPSGAYCPSASIVPTLCGAGHHRDTPGATHLANCLLCLPGTYSVGTGRTSNCPVCQANYYCRTSTMLEACPMHTTSAAGSYSRLNCKCDPGYSCTYYKQIQAIVTLNATLADFNSDYHGVKTAFLAAMANAAQVSVAHVVINGVIARTSFRRMLSTDAHADASFEATRESTWRRLEGDHAAGRRSLLSVAGDSGAGIKIFVSVDGSGRLHNLDQELAKHSKGLFIEHRWEPAHRVKTELTA